MGLLDGQKSLLLDKKLGGRGHTETSKLCHLPGGSVVSDSVTPWTAARQAPLSLGFSRQEYWSGLPCPPPEESSQPRDQTQVSRLAGGFSTS